MRRRGTGETRPSARHPLHGGHQIVKDRETKTSET